MKKSIKISLIVAGATAAVATVVYFVKKKCGKKEVVVAEETEAIVEAVPATEK